MLPRQEGPISDGAVRRAVKHDTSGDRRAMPHTRLLVNTAGVEPLPQTFDEASVKLVEPVSTKQHIVLPLILNPTARSPEQELPVADNTPRISFWVVVRDGRKIGVWGGGGGVCARLTGASEASHQRGRVATTCGWRITTQPAIR